MRQSKHAADCRQRLTLFVARHAEVAFVAGCVFRGDPPNDSDFMQRDQVFQSSARIAIRAST